MRRTKSLLIGAVGLGAFIAFFSSAPTAHAQLGQTGQVTGVVTDDANGSPLAGVTVVATSPALQGTQAELTDGSGRYTILNLPVGTYVITFYYSDITVRRTDVSIQLGKTVQVNGRVNTGQAGGEVITIKEKPSSIDVGSTKQGITVDQDYMRNIPLPGRTFEGALSGAAGSQADDLGISFSGSTSLENSYIIDGINTTGLSFGNAGSPILNNFIQEQEVITGGYDAEFGRSTGGVVNVVTKSGSNEFHGTVWTNFEPRQLRVEPTPIASSSTAIFREAVPQYALDFGFDLGGPIIKDKLWFYVGFAPVINRTRIIRKVLNQVDREDNTNNYAEVMDADGDSTTSNAKGCERTYSCESDTLADVDPETGFTRFEELGEARQNLNQTVTQYNILAKVNFAVNPDHQGAVSFFGLPESYTSVSNIWGTPESTHIDVSALTTDASVKWTSKFLNNKTQVDAVLGWHRDKFSAEPHFRSIYGPDQGGDAMCDADPANCTRTAPRVQEGADTAFNDPSLGVVGRNPNHPESQSVLDNCTDIGAGDPTVNDPFPSIVNCPINAGYQYRWGGAGGFQNTVEQRYSAKVSVTERVKAAGHHEIKLGADLEQNLLDDARFFTGGELDFFYGYWYRYRWVRTAGDPLNQAMDPNFATEFPETCGTTLDYNGDGTLDPTPCKYLDSLNATGNTFNWATYLQDKWQILPNLTLKAGIRYEQQILKFADQIQGTTDPVTGDTLGTNAMNLKNLVAPRVGVLYDWTKEGRSKVYANFGRFYESIPMDINTRSFGGETQDRKIYDATMQCNTPIVGVGGVTILPSTATTCTGNPIYEDIPGASTAVQPGVKPQYLDEFVAGVEYELLEDLNVGASYQNRRLGRVIEDVSVDGATTYFVANPGEFSRGEEAKLENEISDLMTADPADFHIPLLQTRLDQLRKIRGFDKPRREYNAFTLTAKKRYSRNFFVQGSYTFSKLEGNYPGLYSADNGQIDPNISSQYDLIELLTNHDGRLNADRPHIIKLDGYYNFDLKEAGDVTTGVRLRAYSGTPVDTLGAHYIYGTNESFILPRGSFGRAPFETIADLHIAYGREIGKDMHLEVFADIFNIFNLETSFDTDEAYTYYSVNPIVGGTKDDLPYLKHVDETNGNETGETIHKNTNFTNTVQRQPTLRARLGVQLRF